jgi:hypothetical protein
MMANTAMMAMDEACVLAVDGDVERIRGARRKLRQVRQILMTPSPEQLGDCGPVLEEAVALLGCLMESRKSGDQIPAPKNELLMDEVQVLRRELSVVTALMQQAAGYYLGWAQMLGAATGGYNNHGEAAPVTGGSQLSVEG